MLSGMNLRSLFGKVANYLPVDLSFMGWEAYLTSFAPEVISLFFNPVPRALAIRLKKH